MNARYECRLLLMYRPYFCLMLRTWQYTDIVLEGDFVLTLKAHDEGGGGDGYTFIGFHEKSYTTYTHDRLNGNGGFASAAYWGAYSVPGNKIDVSFDGLNGKEGTKYVPKESAATYYWSWVRKDGKMYTYDSAKAPGTADVTKVMKLRHTFSKTYTGPLRFGFFLHDKNDYVEIYSPGSRIGSACADAKPGEAPADHGIIMRCAFARQIRIEFHIRRAGKGCAQSAGHFSRCLAGDG